MAKNKIAVIGLGIMGHGIADNFLKNGFEVIVWNRSQDKCSDLVTKGAKLANSIAEAAKSADLVFEVTANDESSYAIWFEDDGVLANAKPSQTLITCATLSIAYTQKVADECAAKGLNFFDMPLTGGRIGAETGQLTLLAGGNEKKLGEIEVDLKAIAKDIKYFGEATSGMKYKLILNSVQAVHLSMFGEAMRMAELAGLDKNLVGDTLVERPGGISTIIARDSFQNEPEEVSFSVEWIAKDLVYAAEMAAEIDLPLLSDALETFVDANKNGLGKNDWTIVNK